MNDDAASRLLQPGHHLVEERLKLRSAYGDSPKSSEASDPASEDEHASDEEGSAEEIIEEDYEEGGWSDEEDEETRKVRALKKQLHGSADSEEILLADVLFRAPKLSLHDGDVPVQPPKRGTQPINRHLQALQFRREKSNSTSSLYVNSTISAPNLDQVLWCMGTAIFYHTTAGHNAEPVLFEIFDEHKYPIVKGTVDTSNAPSQKDIYKFLYAIFKAEKLPAECAILCLAYIERLIANTRITLHASNWRRVTLGALILASKVWEDQAVWNVDFLSVFPNVSVNDLNKLEKYFLELVTYNVSLKASEYAKYYFELRELAEKDSKSFPLKPLTTLDAQRLEQRAIETERRVKKLQRTASADALPIKSPRAVIN